MPYHELKLIIYKSKNGIVELDEEVESLKEEKEDLKRKKLSYVHVTSSYDDYKLHKL